MLKLTTDKHEASRCLSATAELLVFNSHSTLTDRYFYFSEALNIETLGDLIK